MVSDIIDLVNKNLKGQKIRGADIAIIVKNVVVSTANPVVGIIVAVIEGLLTVLSWYRNSQLHVFNGYQMADLPYKNADASALAADLQQAGAGIVAQRKVKTRGTVAASQQQTSVTKPTATAAGLGDSVKDFWAAHSKKVMTGLGVVALLYVLFQFIKNFKRG